VTGMVLVVTISELVVFLDAAPFLSATAIVLVATDLLLDSSKASTTDSSLTYQQKNSPLVKCNKILQKIFLHISSHKLHRTCYDPVLFSQ